MMTGVLVSIPHRQTQNINFITSLLYSQYVSIPHRQTQNCRMIIKELLHRLVSIPHRQTQNSLAVFSERPADIVSIPHRQTQNVERPDFLILHPLFQFLIGRLKTLSYRFHCTQVHQFQFLIGRLKTVLLLPILFYGLHVSIPHRQTQNDIQTSTFINIPVSFNSS